MFYEFHDLAHAKIPVILHFDEVQNCERNYTFFKYGKITHKKTTKETYVNWHENIEFFYVTKGSGTLFLNGFEHTITENNVYSVNSNELHNISSKTGISYYCLILDNSFCTFLGANMEKYTFPICINDETSIKLFKNITDAFLVRGTFREISIKSAASAFICHITKNFSKPTMVTKEYIATQSVRDAIKYIKENATTDLSVENICHISGYSKSHFSYLFKQATGMTIVDCIKLTRCQIARELLRNSNLKIHEVAEKSGFSGVSYFTRTYKKLTGHLPSEENS